MELVIYVPLAVVFVLGLRRIFRSGWRTVSEPKSALLLLAYCLLFLPVVLFVLSHLVTPVFAPRYFLPSGVGLAIVLTASADALGADVRSRSRWLPHWMWVAIVLFLMAAPVSTALVVGPITLSRAYLDVARVEQMAPQGVPVLVVWQEDFVKFMRLSPTRSATTSCWIGRQHWWGQSIRAGLSPHASLPEQRLLFEEHLDSASFLCTYTDFLVVDAPNASTLDAMSRNSPDMMKPNSFDLKIRTMPQFEWNVVASLDAFAVTRKLIAVHRKAPLPYCR